jgi:energy-coupling factor transporter ATP-binding protein EcfA2
VYVTGIRLSDIKGFTGTRTVDLALRPSGGWTVITGRNGSGKSTLLRALALALNGPSMARSLVSDFRGWITAGADSHQVQARVAPSYPFDGPIVSSRRPDAELVLNMQWTAPPATANAPPARAHRPDLTHHVAADVFQGRGQTTPMAGSLSEVSSSDSAAGEERLGGRQCEVDADERVEVATVG